MSIALEQTTFLGPATVLKKDEKLLHLDLGDHCCWAEAALAFPYQPRVGDVVLAIGHEEKMYVIGVITGTGATTLTVPGDLQINAPRGVIQLRAAKGICLKSRSVKIVAEKLETFARSAFEHFTEATRWVKEAFQERFGSLRTRIKSAYQLKAQTIDERAEGAVRIDGQKIHLG